MTFGTTERSIILSEINPRDIPEEAKEFPVKTFFTIAYDIIESDKSLFIIDLGCTIIFSPAREYKVVARSSVGIKEYEAINTLLLRIKSEEEIPELEKLIEDDIDKHKNDFMVYHKVKPAFTAMEMEDAISDALQRGSK